MSSLGRVVGKITCFWQSLLIITVIKLVLKWLNMKHCMATGVFPHFFWDVVGERSLVGPDWVQQAHDKVREIRQNLLTAQSHQKSYADVRRRDLESTVGDEVLLKVSPTKGVVRLALERRLARCTLDLT